MDTASQINTFYGLMPQNVDALALKIVASCAVADGANNALKYFVPLFNKPHFKWSYHVALAFSCAFFTEKKDIRMSASEVLYNQIERRNIDLALFSQTLVFLIRNKYGVFSRFTDSMLSLKDSSSLHNTALFEIFDSILAHLNAEDLPHQFKKMFENYYDLSVKTGLKPSENTQTFLTQLKERSGYQKIVKQLFLSARL